MKLVLTPKETTEGHRLEVAGDVALFLGDDVMEDSSLEGTSQQYIVPRILIAVVLDPSLPLAV